MWPLYASLSKGGLASVRMSGSGKDVWPLCNSLSEGGVISLSLSEGDVASVCQSHERRRGLCVHAGQVQYRTSLFKSQ